MAARLRRGPAPPPRSTPWASLWQLLGLTAVLVLLAGAVALGGWHLWRYVLAPRFDLVPAEAQIAEAVRVVASPFRTIEEKEAALARLEGMRDRMRTLPESERRRLAAELAVVPRLEEVPLEIVYRAVRIQALLDGRAEAPRPRPTTAATQRHRLRFRERLDRLERLVALEREAFREARPERLRLIVGLARERLCSPRLGRILERLRHRLDAETVERSFVYGILAQRRERCS